MMNVCNHILCRIGHFSDNTGR